MSEDPHYSREKEKYENPVASREFLLETLSNANKSLSFLEVCNIVNAKDEDARIGIQRRLRAMEREGQVAFTRDKKYEVQKAEALIRGRVIGHRDGYGFLKHSDTEKDLFIHQGQMQTLLHDDIVEGIQSGVDRRGRAEFRLNRVLEPRKEHIVGRFFMEEGVSIVIPDDNRISHEIMIPPEVRNGARQGHVVVVEITQRPRRQINAIGKILEVLGEHMAPGMEIEMALRNFDIPHNWPKGVLKQVEGLAEEVPEQSKKDRIDLRELPLMTIDGEDARDFDDAVYCQPNKDGSWQLWVAIADVSSYVKTGTALDSEAQNRATSVYFPEKVIPMLPEVLSNGLCSLNPDVDRLCLVCEMTISAEGKLGEYEFYEAVMRSHARLTYNKVWGILKHDETLVQRYEKHVPHINNLNHLFKALKKARQGRGAIEFETIESKFVFNAQRKISHIIAVQRNEAHMLIEECMIMANVCAAEFLQKNKAEGLFRIHDKPDEDRLVAFKTYLSEIGIPFTVNEVPTPADFTSVMKKIQHRPDKELIQTMLLRSMKQAVYSPDNVGHFGLALEAYAHFTSPIRRYPDLVVHRAIKAIVDKHNTRKSKTGGKFYSAAEVEQLGEQCSMAERRADDATRDVSDWLKCEFMQDHVGDVFEGIIASVTNFGLFVRITEFQIDGLVHITSLASDYYRYDDQKQCLVGESSGVVFRLGDEVKIKVAGVNLDERKIDLMIDGVTNTRGKVNPPRKRSAKKAGKKDAGGKAPKDTSSANDKPTAKQKPVGKRKPGPASKVRKSSKNKKRT
ncbi:ribonuclease R [Brumicola pallidula]|jgi:ribonuclease R|uniref:Ribonuclease R n=1 Tax=Brumicola pallidula DSM 14239 = ACAM 615 TaxID=1121922 RepID=K6YYL3_9ALTE|nr:ribonuclease R [Glaciecola pallidula]GAC29076.1 ribonuclease R [Glaciecola pallidula DSM 14239 = ACAM 615]